MRSLKWVVCLVLAAAAAGAQTEWRQEGPFLSVVNDVAFDPANPAVVYAATAAGGVWRSDDGGRNWTLPGDELTSRAIRWVEVDRTTSSTVWAGEDNPGNVALWRSTDRGATWKPVTGPVKGEINSMHPVGQRIAFAPSQPATIYVPSTNLHYRTTDGGKTWTDFRVPGQDAYAMAVDPKNPKVVYAGGRGEKAQLSRSEDGAKTWKQAGKGLPENSIRILLIPPGEPSTLYASVGFGALYKSTDRGETFTQLPLPLSGTEDLFSLVLDPSDPDNLWASTEKGLLWSGDGGKTWRGSERGMGRWLCKDVAFDPTNPRNLLAGTAGTGIYRSTDGGVSWTASNAGLAGGWAEGLYVPAGAGPWFAQLSVGLFRRDASGTWSEVQEPFEEGEEAEPDGMLFDRTSPKTVWAFDTSKAWRSTDGGLSWQPLELKEPSMREMLKGSLETAQFRSLAQDPGNPKVFYAGAWSNDEPGKAVFKTTDLGKTWKPSGNGVPNETVRQLVAAAPNTVYALVDEHDVFRTTDGGGAWKSAGSGLPDATVRTLAVDPSSPTRLYAATEKGFYRTTDGGGAWQAVAGLKDQDVEAVAVSAAGAVFAGTFRGVFVSRDGGGTWTPVAPAPPHADVRALAIGGAPARLYAGTAGGSVYSTALP